MADNDEELYSDEDYQKDLEAGENFFAEEPETSEEEREAYQQWQDQAKKDMPTPEEIGRVINDPDKMYGLADKATGGLSSAIHIMRTRDNPPLGRHELTRDDLLDMWKKQKDCRSQTGQKPFSKSPGFPRNLNRRHRCS